MSEGSPVDLVNAVQYQEGAVVSKTLMQGEGGTVTLFAFDKNQGLSEHTAPYDALVHVLDGVAEVILAGKKHSVAGGQMLLMPANRPHALRAPQRFKMILTMIRAGS